MKNLLSNHDQLDYTLHMFEKLFPRVLAQPTLSFVYICDLLIKGFVVTGCQGCKCWHDHTTLNIIITLRIMLIMLIIIKLMFLLEKTR